MSQGATGSLLLRGVLADPQEAHQSAAGIQLQGTSTHPRHNGPFNPSTNAPQAKNFVPGKEAQSTKVAAAVIDLQRRLPRARVLYCSATGVSEVRAAAARLGGPFPGPAGMA